MKLNPLQKIKGYRFLRALIDLQVVDFCSLDPQMMVAIQPGGRGGGGGGRSPYDGLYGEAPPERGTFLKL